MRHRIILAVIIFFFGALFYFWNFFKDLTFFGVCSQKGFCESDWLDNVWFPVYNIFPYLIASVSILIFFPFIFFKTWLKIILPYSVISLILISITPGLCGGMVCFDRTDVAQGLSKIFLILTILIIIGKSIHLLVISKRNKKQ
ncbi:MAG: hypothetical protein WCO12_03920 [bacterium]